ncbi:class A beta-lactamase-related serine hydrolase [Chitinophaga horti]|uniref:Class A beta-lactamase-related serine hydrolase n=1 Tax=Chitinophaga horti TaxID=2920382 RepID=A0ABY6J2L7_9BACT|nr:class A beta-lactamase-related serine hydrolase [Chitinophaga horti]UYQ92549.1 class A beta-lactamase-related serine hydrolase [Chitinophaga horti]
MSIHAQSRTDKFLEELLRRNASPALKHILDHPDTFQCQIIYTRIDRDAANKPGFTHFYYDVDAQRYFNPASTVKMPLAFLALEKMRALQLDKDTPMYIDSAFDGQTRVSEDTSAANGLASIAHYIRKVFLVSDNDAYNRLYEFVGQQTIHEQLWAKGYKDARIVRRFAPMTEEGNRHTNPIRFKKNGKTVYTQPAAYCDLQFDYSRPVFIGKAHWDKNDSLIQQPMDFTRHNNVPLPYLQQMLQSVLFPATMPAEQRFNLAESDRRFLLRYMSMLPSESHYPKYDTTEFFDSYTKFFWFKANRSKIPEHIRSFNKTGWSYGFLTDVAYITDFKHNVEFMLSAVIYVNSDGVLNDNKYEYDTIGYPFFKEVGEIIYNYELSRKRRHAPDLSEFKFKYND